MPSAEVAITSREWDNWQNRRALIILHELETIRPAPPTRQNAEHDQAPRSLQLQQSPLSCQILTPRSKVLVNDACTTADFNRLSTFQILNALVGLQTFCLFDRISDNTTSKYVDAIDEMAALVS